MTRTSRDIIEPTGPYPPRFWWLKRILLLLSLLVAILLVLRAVAVHRAQRQLDQEVAALKARGQPVQWSDIHQAILPDDQNAAVILLNVSRI